MLNRILWRTFVEQKHVGLLTKYNTLVKAVEAQQKQIELLKSKMKEHEQRTELQNKKVYESRLKLSEDVRKGEQIWTEAKKKSEANKSAAINSFAQGLIELSDQFAQVKRYQTEKHSIDLREGFDNTSKLFYSTLEKFKVKPIALKVGDKPLPGTVQFVGEQKTTEASLIGTVSKVVQQGWQVQDKLARRAKVAMYV